MLKSYAFLAPLSDPIIGSEKAPEPRRAENHGIDMFVILKSFLHIGHLSDPVFGSEIVPEPKR